MSLPLPHCPQPQGHPNDIWRWSPAPAPALPVHQCLVSPLWLPAGAGSSRTGGARRDEPPSPACPRAGLFPGMKIEGIATPKSDLLCKAPVSPRTEGSPAPGPGTRCSVEREPPFPRLPAPSLAGKAGFPLEEEQFPDPRGCRGGGREPARAPNTMSREERGGEGIVQGRKQRVPVPPWDTPRIRAEAELQGPGAASAPARA